MSTNVFGKWPALRTRVEEYLADIAQLDPSPDTREKLVDWVLDLCAEATRPATQKLPAANALEYVVRRPVFSTDPGMKPFYWSVYGKWHPCQTCAQRFTFRDAHHFAHYTAHPDFTRHTRVLRVVRKKAP